LIDPSGHGRLPISEQSQIAHGTESESLLDRFATFDSDARRALDYALASAERLGEPQVGLRLILIGIARAEVGAAGPLRGSAFEASRLRLAVPGSLQRRTPTTLAVTTKVLIEQMILEAKERQSGLSTAHLVLGALTAGDDAARVALVKGGGHIVTGYRNRRGADSAGEITILGVSSRSLKRSHAYCSSSP